jgi:hypothetical protein
VEFVSYILELLFPASSLLVKPVASSFQNSVCITVHQIESFACLLTLEFLALQILVEPSSKAAITKYGNIRIEVQPAPSSKPQTPKAKSARPKTQNPPHTGSGTSAHKDEDAVGQTPNPAPILRTVGTDLDVVQLSIFNNRFMGIAEQMGRTLQRTSISTNIKVSHMNVRSD